MAIHGLPEVPDGLAPFMMLSDLRTPEVGSCARVIMHLLRNHLQEDWEAGRKNTFNLLSHIFLGFFGWLHLIP